MSKEYNVKNTTELNKILSFGFNSKLTEAVVNDLENMGMFSSADGRLQVYAEAGGTFKLVCEDEALSEIMEAIERGKDLDSILSKGDPSKLSSELIDARERELQEIKERRLRKKSGSPKHSRKEMDKMKKKIDVMKVVMIFSILINTVCVAVTLWWPTNPAARFYQFFWVITQTLMVLYTIIALTDNSNSKRK